MVFTLTLSYTFALESVYHAILKIDCQNNATAHSDVILNKVSQATV